MNTGGSASQWVAQRGFNPINDPARDPTTNPPRSLYIHVPFCRHRCGYCNFALVAGRDYLFERFLNAIETEIGWLQQRWPIDTLFLGGGTPSHLSAEHFRRLMEIINERFEFASNAEVTIECNPSDIDADKVALLADCGINRVSLGVQSFDSEKLNRLERDHDARQVVDAVECIRTRIDDISLDLIFAAPEESMAVWESDLKAAIELQPSHLSTYELTWEKGTQFWNRLNRDELAIGPEEVTALMYERAIDFLGGYGFEQYEVSSFAAAGKRCRHNLQYWNRSPWFAFGPGAARFIDGVRQTNHRSTMQYLKRIEARLSPVADVEHLHPQQAAAEGVAIGLRKIDGISKPCFLSQYGTDINSVLGDFKTTLFQHRLATETAERFGLTRAGMMVCDGISAQIIANNEGAVEV